jgi:hypothetical protein
MLVRCCTFGLLALAAACSSDTAKKATYQDTRGNFATTSNFNSLERTDFTKAMHDGLIDFDLQLKQLELQAEKLGPDAVTEYHKHIDDLAAKRREFAAELSRHDAMLADEWRKYREDIADDYVSLRKDLDEAYEEVIEEGS